MLELELPYAPTERRGVPYGVLEVCTDAAIVLHLADF